MNTSKPHRIGFLLLPEFSHFGLLAAMQPLFLANWRAQRPVFAWSTLSPDGRPVRASNGTLVTVDAALNIRLQLHTLFVLASFEPKQHAANARLRSALVRAAGSGVQIGGIETGSEVLAAAGLLDGRTAAVHWDNLDGFRERYPKVNARGILYHCEPGRLTCAGGTTVIDMMLQFVASEIGAELSREVARQMLVTPRAATLGQPDTLDAAAAEDDELVRAAISLMSGNLDEPLDAREIAHRLRISARQLRRRFRRGTGMTPARNYLKLRLSRAHNLLQQTNLSVTEVAISCGFRSLEHFSRLYRSAFGCPPSHDRRQSISAPIRQRTPARSLD
jgi:AraC family transcriptional regulator, carnitine catabolism transcriptional activator